MKVALCNYYGMRDAEGNVVGHSGKVTREYINLLDAQMCELQLIASPCITNYVKINNVKVDTIISLPYDIYLDVPFTIKRRISDKLKLWKNIRRCFAAKVDSLFFYQVDFFFFLYVFLHGVNGKNTNILLYHSDFTGGKLEPVLQFIYQMALKKIDGILYTAKNTNINHRNAVWIPDFFYSDKIYGRYRNLAKKNVFVCLGTMNRYKKIEELINLFIGTNYKLSIIGRFDDSQRYEKLVELTKNYDNINICDKVLTDDEYYGTMANSRFTILPYDMNQYINRTSGVLQEALFVGSIPISPRELLEQTGLYGIGYDSIKDIDLDSIYNSSILNEEQVATIIEEYGVENTRKKMLEMIVGDSLKKLNKKI